MRVILSITFTRCYLKNCGKSCFSNEINITSKIAEEKRKYSNKKSPHVQRDKFF